METTARPDTAPPRSAIWRALLRLVMAAVAQRTLARTATNIPIRPAMAEHSAPMMKEIVTFQNVPTPICSMLGTSRLKK